MEGDSRSAFDELRVGDRERDNRRKPNGDGGCRSGVAKTVPAPPRERHER